MTVTQHSLDIQRALAFGTMLKDSTNLTNFEQKPIHVANEAVRSEAPRHGVEIADTEIIGLVPGKALEMTAAWYLKVETFVPPIRSRHGLREGTMLAMGHSILCRTSRTDCQRSSGSFSGNA